MAAMNKELMDAVWEHGRAMPEADPSTWRQDACGAWLRREQFGHDAEFGWKIERISIEGAETPDNLRPFHWRNHYDLGTGAPHCRVTADRSGVPAEKYARPPRNREA
ncbi:MAG: hypothetical protein A3I01_10610 [Betaproteobacteria bacterium RIFCSPLOWO2_02_FULL_65_24]|nr:MAG: hypothetical protein A3I01_10610 [Betaproteobacteria bacterium RIFCSPLOWO2_02_FULL_65_24]OGA83609.1 MAG: hypothetical protein A3G27_15060 [Betaproteobacteria bacterium RIFCSPLOWO2_12_FULL_66_14]